MSSSCCFCRLPGHPIRQCLSHRCFVLKNELEGFMNIQNHYYPPNIYRILLNYSYRDIQMMTVMTIFGIKLNQKKERLIYMVVHFICQERQRRYFQRERQWQREASKKNVLHTIRFIERNENEIQTVVEECPICYETIPPSNLCLTNCNHSFCTSCIMKSLKNKSDCPCCREKIVTLAKNKIDLIL